MVNCRASGSTTVAFCLVEAVVVQPALRRFIEFLILKWNCIPSEKNR